MSHRATACREALSVWSNLASPGITLENPPSKFRVLGNGETRDNLYQFSQSRVKGGRKVADLKVVRHLKNLLFYCLRFGTTAHLETPGGRGGLVSNPTLIRFSRRDKPPRSGAETVSLLS